MVNTSWSPYCCSGSEPTTWYTHKALCMHNPIRESLRPPPPILWREKLRLKKGRSPWSPTSTWQHEELCSSIWLQIRLQLSPNVINIYVASTFFKAFSPMSHFNVQNNPVRNLLVQEGRVTDSSSHSQWSIWTENLEFISCTSSPYWHEALFPYSLFERHTPEVWACITIWFHAEQRVSIVSIPLNAFSVTETTLPTPQQMLSWWENEN